MIVKQKISKAGFVLILIGIGLIACNNNDTSDGTSTITTSSSSDTMNLSNDMLLKKDSSLVSTTTTETVTVTPGSSGTAKPNPAKKGLKGKVIIIEPVKTTGAMEADNTGVYSNVEYIPAFPGGNKGLQTFFNKNIEYPEAASNEGVDGTVNVSFIVDEAGKLTYPSTTGDKLGYGLEEEAIRVVGKMPTWTPGKLNGKNVKTRYTLPVRFELY